MKKRLDQWLVDKGLAPSKTKAQELIESGAVEVQGQVETKAGKKLDQAPREVRLLDSELLKYVSRGGLKLESALEHFNVDVANMSCVDLGASTGGFTHCLLERGAKSVDAVDVGRDQLHEKLRNDQRVQSYEGQDVRGFQGGPYNLVVADLSFISLTKVLKDILKLAEKGTRLLLLVKPQFEVGSVNIGKGGLVKSQAAVQDAIDRISDIMKASQLKDIQWMTSGLAGRDGNQEYFVYAEVM